MASCWARRASSIDIHNWSTPWHFFSSMGITSDLPPAVGQPSGHAYITNWARREFFLITIIAFLSFGRRIALIFQALFGCSFKPMHKILSLVNWRFWVQEYHFKKNGFEILQELYQALVHNILPYNRLSLMCHGIRKNCLWLSLTRANSILGQPVLQFFAVWIRSARLLFFESKLSEWLAAGVVYPDAYIHDEKRVPGFSLLKARPEGSNHRINEQKPWRSTGGRKRKKPARWPEINHWRNRSPHAKS